MLIWDFQPPELRVNLLRKPLCGDLRFLETNIGSNYSFTMFGPLYLQISTATGIKVKFKFPKRKKNKTKPCTVDMKRSCVSCPLRIPPHNENTDNSVCHSGCQPPNSDGLGSAGQPSQNSEAWISKGKLGQAGERVGAEGTDCGAERFEMSGNLPGENLCEHAGAGRQWWIYSRETWMVSPQC